MKRIKSVIFAIVMLALSQPAVSEESQRQEVHPTDWTQLDLKGADKDLGSKIAAQITANPKNAAAFITLDSKFAAGITAAAVSAAPSLASAITTAVNVVLQSSSAMTSASPI